MVVGSRAFSPIVQDVDEAAAFYKQLGLIPDPAGPDGTFPWDNEPWRSELHGAQAPRSQMRYMYVKAPGAVPPATPLLIEPVEHKDIERRPLANRVGDPGVATLVLLVRDLAASAATLPRSALVPVRRLSESWPFRVVTAYGGRARAMVFAVPGGHLVELLQPDPLPSTTAPPDANVIGGWMRFTTPDLRRTLQLYRDGLGLSFTESTVSDDEFGQWFGRSVQVATTVLPQTGMRLEFVQMGSTMCDCPTPRYPGVATVPLDWRPRIQDPGAVRLQLTVRDLEKTIKMFADVGQSRIVSSTPIITQPNYRVTVLQDFNGLFLVLTDNTPSGDRR
jgi:catechol 2,3-dioxygenase-like lactoylglutathione lyase family enzyme